MKNIKIVSCTRHSAETVRETPLYKSIQDLKDLNIELEFIYNNAESLSKVYNKYLSLKDYDFVVFCHDDVYIDDGKLQHKLYNAYNKLGYNIIGIAGGLNPEIRYPALWHIMCSKNHHRGQVATPVNGSFEIYTTTFGITPSRVVVADGCFLAIHLPSIQKTSWKFNENYSFHHYDIASCIDANSLKLKIGVYPIYIIHSSPGLTSLDDPVWSPSNVKFLKEYTKLE